MSPRKLLVALPLLLALVVAAGCVLPDTRAEGRSCTATVDCSDDLLECVAIATDNGNQSVCLPVIDHPPFSCTSGEDCVSQLFPVEAECIQQQCQCPSRSLPCPQDREDLDPFTCSCLFTTGDEGELCTEDVSCRFGLNCVDHRCLRGQAPGDQCSSDFPCDRSDLICNGAGACVGDTGAACTVDADCNSFVCDVDHCS